MGLLSSLGGIAGSFFGGPIGGAIGSALGGAIEGKEAVGQAADIQAGAAQSGIDEQRRQFDAIQKLLQPYAEAGTGALAGQQAFLGLQGPAAERAAIERISGGETFQAMARQGEEALLQRASATGGLRGGNIQGALAQFRPALLSSLIEQQYGRLGGLTTLGQNAAAGVGNAGMQTGTNVATLLGRQGQAQAGGVLGEQGAMTRGIGQAFGAIQGAGGFGKLFGGGSGTSGLQAQFSQTPVGSSGFGSGLAYGNQDLGLNF
jgi:hypothetical protein